MNKIIGLVGLLLVAGVGVVLLAKSPKFQFGTEPSGESSNKPTETAVGPKPPRDMEFDRIPIRDRQPVPSKITPSVIQAVKDFEQPAPSKYTGTIGVRPPKDIQVEVPSKYVEPAMDVRPAVIPPGKAVSLPPLDVRPPVVPQPAKSHVVSEPIKDTTDEPMRNPKFRDPLTSKAKDFAVLPKEKYTKFRG